MEHYDILYWLEILGGNTCYIIMLLALGGVIKKTGAKKVGYMLLVAGMMIGFIIWNPLSGEIRLPGIVAGDYGLFSGGVRMAIGIICTIIPFLFMWSYQFLAFNLQQHHNKNRDKSVFYVYHTFFLLFHAGLWCAWMVSALFFASATGKHFKISWEGIFGVFLVVYYIGGICMAVLRQKTFEVVKGHFKYNGLWKKYEGELESIELVEKTKRGLILQIKGEKLYLGCTLAELVELFSDKIVDKGSENKT